MESSTTHKLVLSDQMSRLSKDFPEELKLCNTKARNRSCMSEKLTSFELQIESPSWNVAKVK